MDLKYRLAQNIPPIGLGLCLIGLVCAAASTGFETGSKDAVLLLLASGLSLVAAAIIGLMGLICWAVYWVIEKRRPHRDTFLHL